MPDWRGVCLPMHPKDHTINIENVQGRSLQLAQKVKREITLNVKES